MKRFGQTIRLKPEGAADYVRHHAAVWPEVKAKIAECNLRNYSIYVHDGVAFSYFEYVGTDFEADMAKMAAHGATQKWWDVVKPLMSPLETRKPGEFWADMEEVFHQD